MKNKVEIITYIKIHEQYKNRGCIVYIINNGYDRYYSTPIRNRQFISTVMAKDRHGFIDTIKLLNKQHDKNLSTNKDDYEFDIVFKDFE